MPWLQVVCRHMGQGGGRLLPPDVLSPPDLADATTSGIVRFHCATGNEPSINACAWTLGAPCAKFKAVGVDCKGGRRLALVGGLPAMCASRGLLLRTAGRVAATAVQTCCAAVPAEPAHPGHSPAGRSQRQGGGGWKVKVEGGAGQEWAGRAGTRILPRRPCTAAACVCSLPLSHPAYHGPPPLAEWERFAPGNMGDEEAGAACRQLGFAGGTMAGGEVSDDPATRFLLAYLDCPLVPPTSTPAPTSSKPITVLGAAAHRRRCPIFPQARPAGIICT